MKSIQVLSFLLSVVFLLPFASCATPEENITLASPVVEITATPMLTPTATPLAQKPARTPTRTLAPTPTPTPTPGPSYAYDPDNPYAALRAYMDAEIAAAPDAGPAPFEDIILSAFAGDLWYRGRFSWYAAMEGCKVEYILYATSGHSDSYYRIVLITENEDFGLTAEITLSNDKTRIYLHGRNAFEYEESVSHLQKETADEQLLYKNTVTGPMAARGEEEPVDRPEMREAIMDKAFAFYVERYGIEPGKYSVVAGDYWAGISEYSYNVGCLNANFEMYIRRITTSEDERWSSYDFVTFEQTTPGDSVEGEFSIQGIGPNYATVFRAAPTLTAPKTDEEDALQVEEIWRRCKEYEDYQWQRLLDQGVYAKEFTVE